MLVVQRDQSVHPNHRALLPLLKIRLISMSYMLPSDKINDRPSGSGVHLDLHA
jgi:hypothetical protein